MSASNYHHIDVDEVVAETENAFLFSINGEEHWIPKSQIANASDYNQGDENCSVSVTDWIARQKGLI